MGLPSPKEIRFGLTHLFPTPLAEGYTMHEFTASTFVTFPIPEDYEFVSFVDNDHYKGARFKIRDMSTQGFDNLVMH